MLLGLTSLVSAAEMTWTGKISDSMCGASHAAMIAAHAGAKMTDHDCANAYVKAGGKYVFVYKDKGTSNGSTPSTILSVFPVVSKITRHGRQGAICSSRVFLSSAEPSPST